MIGILTRRPCCLGDSARSEDDGDDDGDGGGDDGDGGGDDDDGGGEDDGGGGGERQYGLQQIRLMGVRLQTVER